MTFSTDSINVVIADDQKLLAKLMQSYLSNFFNIKLVGSARNGKEVLTMVKSENVDLILMDIMMPELEGLETAKLVLKSNPHVKIVFLSCKTDKRTVSEAIKLGASGFVSKNSTQEEIINAINAVISGEKFFDKEVMNSFLRNEEEIVEATPKSVSKDDIDELTDREREILQLILQELTAPEIAEKLCLSPRTIETHKRNIMAKVGVKSTVSLVKYFYDHRKAVNN